MKKAKQPALRLAPAPKLNPLEQARANIAAAEQGLFDIDWDGVTRIKGDVANGDNTDPVSYSAKTELQMRRMLAHFGFDELPLTWGEMNGVADYCQDLFSASGVGMPAAAVEDWRASSRRVEVRYHAWRVPAMDAYFAGDLEALRRIHRETKMMARLGQEWKEFPYPPDHPLFDA